MHISRGVNGAALHFGCRDGRNDHRARFGTAACPRTGRPGLKAGELAGGRDRVGAAARAVVMLNVPCVDPDGSLLELESNLRSLGTGGMHAKLIEYEGRTEHRN